MAHLACVDIPAFALQVLLGAHPEWRGEAVVLLDRPQASGVVQAVNAAAQKGGVHPGMRYAVALNRLPGLRGGTPEASVLERAHLAVLACLQGFSPGVEPADAGVYWLDVSGLEGLFGSLDGWAQALRAALMKEGYVAAVVVGFSRAGTRAVGRVLLGRRHLVFESAQEERQVVGRVPLVALGWREGVRQALQQLGVKRVGELMNLPAEGIASRWGEEVWQVYQELRGDRVWPLQPVTVPLPHSVTVHWEHGETCRMRLLFQLKGPITQLLGECVGKGHGVTALQVDFLNGSGDRNGVVVRLAEPTVEVLVVLNVLQLRLESVVLEEAVVGAHVAVVGVPVTVRQGDWLKGVPRRDRGLANRAFARLRALFADDGVVVRATVCDSHWPEARFGWEALMQLPEAEPVKGGRGHLVRQLWHPPRAIAPRPVRGDWYPLGFEAGAVVCREGPYRLSGGWWQNDTAREYHRLELASGALLWVFCVPGAEGWFLQGEVR